MSKSATKGAASGRKVTKAEPKSEPKAEPKSEPKAEPKSALTFTYAKPAMRALAQTIGQAANVAVSAGLMVATRLAEAIPFTPWVETGHPDFKAWALALLREATPSASSNHYAWVDAGHARAAIIDAKLDASKFPLDTLRAIGAKSNTGGDVERMASAARELLSGTDGEPSAYLTSTGSVDPSKAWRYFAGESVGGESDGSVDHDKAVKRLVKSALKYGGGKAGAVSLLKDALAAAQKRKGA